METWIVECILNFNFKKSNFKIKIKTIDGLRYPQALSRRELSGITE